MNDIEMLVNSIIEHRHPDMQKLKEIRDSIPQGYMPCPDAADIIKALFRDQFARLDELRRSALSSTG